jgi:protein-S-isoprenylcysteine O-methyltransferase Ste14
MAATRLVAVYAGIAALVAFSRPTPMSVTVGAIFAAAGEAVRLWAAGHLRKTEELVTSGPYRYTRNPLYLGRLFILIGLCVMATLPFALNWVMLLLCVVTFFGYYMPRKERVEPRRLRRIHGDAYERYHRVVPALFPTLRPFPEGASSGWSSDRLLRNREHWMVLGLLLVTLILLWKAYSING